MRDAWTRLLAVTVAGLALAAPALAQPVEREGVKLEPTAQVGGATLQLNGVGLRTRAIFKVYVGALYVPQKSSSPAALLAQKGPRRLSMTMLRNVDADSFTAPLVDGLRNNHSEAQFASFKPQIDALSAAMKAVEEAKKGDVIHVEYLPDSGTRITHNGQQKGASIPGEDFYTAMLRIWLGDKPADGDLKKGLLGG